MTVRLMKRKPMTEQQQRDRRTKLATLEHWARCRRCGATLTGTPKEIMEHHCAAGSKPAPASETA